MRVDEFSVQMARLEELFNGGQKLSEARRNEYYEALKYTGIRLFMETVSYLRDTFKPFPAEQFPSPVTMQDAIIGVSKEKKDEIIEKQTSEFEYCQQCNNIGIYEGLDHEAHFCSCEKGRMKKAIWNIRPEERKREEKIQKALKKIPKSTGPIRGLKEKHPLGFWTDTEERHEQWMEAKRKEIEEIDKKRAMSRPRETIPDELRKKLLKDTIADISKKMLPEEESPL